MEKKYYFRGLGLGIIVTAVIMGIALSGGKKTREMTDDEVIARAKELGMTEDTRLLEPAGEEPDEEENAAEAQTTVRKDVAVKAEADSQKKDVAVKAEADSEKTEGDTADSSAKTDKATGTEQKPTVDTPEPVKTTTSAASSETKPLTRTDTNEMRKQDDDVNSASAQTEGDSGTNSKPAATEADSDTKPASAGMKSVTIVSGDGSYTVAKKLEEAGVVVSAASYDDYLCEHGYDKRLRTGTFQIPADATDEQIAKIVTGQ